MIVAGVVLAAPATALADDAGVEIHGYQYHAPDVSVQAGDAVTWTNGDSAKHDVASTTGPEAFASPELLTGESFTYVFTQPGAYTYLCTLHPDMLGALTVTPAPATTAPPTTVTAVASGGAPVDPIATTTTAAPAGSGEVVAAAPAAAVDPADLESASRPYLEMLAVVAAVLAGALLLFGLGRRGRAAAD